MVISLYFPSVWTVLSHRAATPSRTHSLPSHSWKNNPGEHCAALASCSFRMFQWDLSQVNTKCLWQLHFMRSLPTLWVLFWRAQACCNCHTDWICFHVCTFGFKALSFLSPKQRQSNENSCSLAGVQWRLGIALAALPSQPCPWDTGLGSACHHSQSLNAPQHQRSQRHLILHRRCLWHQSPGQRVN